MKEKIVGLVVFFILLFVFVKLIGPLPVSMNSTTYQKTDNFSVQGTGKVTVNPDIASMRIGYTTSASTVKTAREQMNKTINTVSDAIKKLGVLDKDIKTENLSIYPDYDWSNGKQRINGYQASVTLALTVRDLDNVNPIVDKATELGANEVGNINFEVEDKETAMNKARELAVADAKKKAQDAARIANFKLGRIVNYSENPNSDVRPMMLEKAAVPVSGGGGATQIEPGTNEITVTVYVSYELL